MNAYEKREIQGLPNKYHPLSSWAYLGYSLLFMIPIIGAIFIIVYSINGNNINRRSFARSYLLPFLLICIIGIILFVVFLVGIFMTSKS